jgi:hypothetical protein
MVGMDDGTAGLTHVKTVAEWRTVFRASRMHRAGRSAACIRPARGYRDRDFTMRNHLTCRITGLLLLLCLSLPAARAETISRREVLAAIAVLEKDVTSAEAVMAAQTVTRFGKESEAVLITVGPETLPWVQEDAPEAEARVRAMLMAVYFAADIKAQLEKHQAVDDPYKGWLAVIKAYRQIRKKQPDIEIDEVEELIRKEQAGTLKQEAEDLMKEQTRQDSSSRDVI